MTKSDFNARAVEHSKLEDPGRDTWLKQNISGFYNVKVPGYDGHKPACNKNDRGTVRPKCLDTTGETFC